MKSYAAMVKTEKVWHCYQQPIAIQKKFSIDQQGLRGFEIAWPASSFLCCKKQKRSEYK
jgi:hypothetical protein